MNDANEKGLISKEQADAMLAENPSLGDSDAEKAAIAEYANKRFEERKVDLCHVKNIKDMTH